MQDQSQPLPLDDNTSEEQVTDTQSNQEVDSQQTQQAQQQNEQTEQTTEADNDLVNQDTNQEQENLSRSERRQQRYAEKMAERLRTQSEQDAQYGKQLFSQDQNYQPLQYQEGDYDVDQLLNDRKQYGQQTFNEGIRQGQAFYEAERFADRLEVDIDRVLSKRDDIDEVTEKMLVESYLDKVGAKEDRNGRLIIGNPNIRFRDYADAKLKEIDDLVQAQISKSTRNIASQAAKTGIRPNGQSQSSITSLSDDTLVQRLRESKDEAETAKLLAETRRRAGQALGIN